MISVFGMVADQSLFPALDGDTDGKRGDTDGERGDTDGKRGDTDEERGDTDGESKVKYDKTKTQQQPMQMRSSRDPHLEIQLDYLLYTIPYFRRNSDLLPRCTVDAVYALVDSIRTTIGNLKYLIDLESAAMAPDPTTVVDRTSVAALPSAGRISPSAGGLASTATTTTTTATGRASKSLYSINTERVALGLSQLRDEEDEEEDSNERWLTHFRQKAVKYSSSPSYPSETDLQWEERELQEAIRRSLEDFTSSDLPPSVSHSNGESSAKGKEPDVEASAKGKEPDVEASARWRETLATRLEDGWRLEGGDEGGDGDDERCSDEGGDGDDERNDLPLACNHRRAPPSSPNLDAEMERARIVEEHFFSDTEVFTPTEEVEYPSDND